MAPNSSQREMPTNDCERICAWCGSLLGADRSRTACRTGGSDLPRFVQVVRRAPVARRDCERWARASAVMAEMFDQQAMRAAPARVRGSNPWRVADQETRLAEAERALRALPPRPSPTDRGVEGALAPNSVRQREATMRLYLLPYFGAMD